MQIVKGKLGSENCERTMADIEQFDSPLRRVDKSVISFTSCLGLIWKFKA
jgi:hypothetical protein